MAKRNLIILNPLSSILCFFLLLTAAGCNLGGALAYKLMGPPAVPAEYVPAKQPILVLVESYDRPSTGEFAADQLARNLVEQLEAHDIAPPVSLEKLHELRTATKPEDFRQMTIPAIGRACGADQVLYVNLAQSDIETVIGSQQVKAKLGARVRVVDALSGNTRWPSDAAAGYPLAVETAWAPIRTEADITEIRQDAYRSMADQIAKLFYKWKPDEFAEAP